MDESLGAEPSSPRPVAARELDVPARVAAATHEGPQKVIGGEVDSAHL